MTNRALLALRVVALLPLSLAAATAARAQAGADTPAALLAFPYVVVDSATGRDTRLQISNVGDAAVSVRCYFQRANGECIDGQAGESCFLEAPTCSGFCTPRFELVEWSLYLEAHQPVGWVAGKGRAAPEIAALPDESIGPLRCIAQPVSGNNAPNVLVGLAEVERVGETGLDTAAYSAFGFRAIDGHPNGDNTLVLGGVDGEYRGCPDSLILQNFFDGAELTGDALDDAEVTTSIVTMPCGGDLAASDPDPTQILTYFAYNEVAQRFSNSRRIRYDVRPLSTIDTVNDPTRSIFHVDVQGTLTGHVDVHAVQDDRGGVLVLAIQRHRKVSGEVTTAIYSPHLEGERAVSETLLLPGALPTVIPPTPIETLAATATATVPSTPTITPSPVTPEATATASHTPPRVPTATGTSAPPPTNPPGATVTATGTAALATATRTAVAQTSGSSSGGGCQTSSGGTGILPLAALPLLLFASSRRRAALLVAATAFTALAASHASAQLTGERGASILSFPRVAVGENTDTVIQISTSAETEARAHCYYLAAEGGPQIDFEIHFQKQQPMHWLASTGKSDDSAFGNVPPLAPSFAGELICVELSLVEGLPISGNSLRGSATILDKAQGASRYAALGARGFPTNDHDGVLCLGGSPRPGCPDGAEYEGCPQSWYLNHAIEGTVDEIQEGGSSSTILTVVPCARDLLAQTAAAVTLSFTLTDEVGQQFSGTMEVEGWGSFSLADISASFVGTGAARYGSTVIRPVNGSGGFALSAQIVRRGGGESTAASAAAFDVPRDGSGAADEIVLPIAEP